MNSNRLERVNKVIKKELALIFAETLPADFGMVTVTAVQTSADLKHANAYISLLDSEKMEEVLKYLNQNRFMYMKKISPRLRFKYTPNLVFQRDNSLENLQKVSELLDTAKNN